MGSKDLRRSLCDEICVYERAGGKRIKKKQTKHLLVKQSFPTCNLLCIQQPICILLLKGCYEEKVKKFLFQKLIDILLSRVISSMNSIHRATFSRVLKISSCLSRLFIKYKMTSCNLLDISFLTPFLCGSDEMNQFQIKTNNAIENQVE